MSHQRLQESEKARDCYSRALQLLTNLAPSGREAEELNAFRAEAEALLGQSPKR